MFKEVNSGLDRVLSPSPFEGRALLTIVWCKYENTVYEEEIWNINWCVRLRPVPLGCVDPKCVENSTRIEIKS